MAKVTKEEFDRLAADVDRLRGQVCYRGEEKVLTASIRSLRERLEKLETVFGPDYAITPAGAGGSVLEGHYGKLGRPHYGVVQTPKDVPERYLKLEDAVREFLRADFGLEIELVQKRLARAIEEVERG